MASATSEALKWTVIAAAVVAFYFLVKGSLANLAGGNPLSQSPILTGAVQSIGAAPVQLGEAATTGAGNAIGQWFIDAWDGLFGDSSFPGGSNSYQLNPSFVPTPGITSIPDSSYGNSPYGVFTPF